nr:extracellular solute-binding protein [Nocardioides flavescens]
MQLGVWGGDAEIAAYQGVVDTYNAAHPEVKVKIQPFADHDALKQALDAGEVPDVFLASRSDLQDLIDNGVNQPVSDLLDERNVDFGDGYSRPALEAFASDRELQCMPYGVSPMVIYYNRALVDFTKMAERDLPVPNLDEEDLSKKPAWNYAMFEAAANFSSRPRRGIAGFHVQPTLRGLAPFVYSAGGQIFDDDEAPTSLAFSSDDTRSALEQVLPLLRDPKVDLTPEQLAQKSAIDWFKEGKLGMIAGFRSMVPELRATPGLDFDVMPMPIVDDAATVGELTGVCLAEDTKETAAAADLLVDLISTESVSTVAEAGYLAPANIPVALSEAFLQPGTMPAHSIVFNSAVRSMRIPPLLGSYSELEAAVDGPIEQLLTVELPDLDALTDEIDAASQSVLAPDDASEEPSPSEDDSE